MKHLFLGNLQLKTFTEQDASDYCQINYINLKEVIVLNLYNNKLTDISGIKLFKNIEVLYLDYNQIKDISVFSYLINIKYLSIRGLELESDQIQYINSLKNLKELYCKNGFKDMTAVKYLNKNIRLVK